MRHCYDFEKEISRWDEGIPLGNGQIGALLWGKPQDLRVSLDRSDIWDTTPCPETGKEEQDPYYFLLLCYVKRSSLSHRHSAEWLGYP